MVLLGFGCPVPHPPPEGLPCTFVRLFGEEPPDTEPKSPPGGGVTPPRPGLMLLPVPTPGTRLALICPRGGLAGLMPFVIGVLTEFMSDDVLGMDMGF